MSTTPPRIATLTFSDTRTPETDEGGRVLGELLRAASFTVVSHAIVREEDDDEMRAALRGCIVQEGIQAIVVTGGTGIAPRDRAIEVVAPLFDKTIDGFGEAFRRLSWAEVGPRSILSRAAAGVIEGKIVALLPGSVAAVRLAVNELIVPVLAHAIAVTSGHASHGAHDKSPRPR